MSELSPEDLTLITLARGAQGRVGASSGAAVRDDTGRSYASAAVHLESISVTAIQAVVVAAVAAGARGLEALVLVGDEDLRPGLAAAFDLGGTGVPVVLCTLDGNVTSTTST